MAGRGLKRPEDYPGLPELLEKYRSALLPPPHWVWVDPSAVTDYCDIRRMEVYISERSLRRGEEHWSYPHELGHLIKWPGTPANDLALTARARRIARSMGYLDFFNAHRSRLMNQIYDAFIDWDIAKRFPEARKAIKRYLREAYPKARDMDGAPPLDRVRAAAVSRAMAFRYPDLAAAAGVGDFDRIAAETIRYYASQCTPPPPSNLKVDHTAQDYQEAAAILVAEGLGELVGEVEEMAEEEGCGLDVDEALLLALVKSYDWYLSPERPPTPSTRAGSGLDVWAPGEDESLLDVNASLSSFPRLVPGLTTLKRSPLPREGRSAPSGFKSVTFLVDESGSMAGLGKDRAVRKAGISLLALLHRHSIPFQVIGFGRRAYERVKYGYDYLAGARYFAFKYRPYQSTTELSPALQLIRGRDVLLYILTDAAIFDLNRVAEIDIKEAVIVFIERGARGAPDACRDLAEALGCSVRGYALDPDDVEKFIVQELGRLS